MFCLQVFSNLKKNPIYLLEKNSCSGLILCKGPLIVLSVIFLNWIEVWKKNTLLQKGIMREKAKESFKLKNSSNDK